MLIFEDELIFFFDELLHSNFLYGYTYVGVSIDISE